MNIDEIISKLEYNDGKLPRVALTQAIEKREFVTPLLLQAIKDATRSIQKIEGDEAYMLHIYSLYLLAQFRETEAYLPIVEFFSMPGDVVMEVTGDVVTEDLGRILASTFNGSVEPIHNIVESKDVNVYIRSAGLQALCVLWGCEEISRQDIVSYYRYVLSEVLVGDDPLMWSASIASSFDFSPDELEAEIEEAFDNNLIDKFYFDRGDFSGSLGLSNDEALARFREIGRNRRIDNTILELEHWACFRSERKRKNYHANLASRTGKQKVGRNDPCICGSGRKYKRCCYSSAAKESLTRR